MAFSERMGYLARPLKYIVDERGRRTAVVLPLPQFNRLIRDMRLLAAVADVADEESLSVTEFQSLLRQDGILPP